MCVTYWPFVSGSCDPWQNPYFSTSGTLVMHDWQTIWNCTIDPDFLLLGVHQRYLVLYVVLSRCSDVFRYHSENLRYLSKHKKHTFFSFFHRHQHSHRFLVGACTGLHKPVQALQVASPKAKWAISNFLQVQDFFCLTRFDKIKRQQVWT